MKNEKLFQKCKLPSVIFKKKILFVLKKNQNGDESKKMKININKTRSHIIFKHKITLQIVITLCKFF
jgi:hypothetical protein